MYKRKVSKLTLSLYIFFISFLFLISLADAQKAVPAKEKYGGTLRVAIPIDFSSLDGRFISRTSGSRGNQEIYNRLGGHGPKGVADIVPSIATDWKKIDNLTWIVNIRKGVKFHNGKELTAEDVFKNYDWKLRKNYYTKEKGWRSPRGLSTIVELEKVEVVDRYTLRFTLRPEYSNFPSFVPVTLAWGVRGIIDPDIVEKYGGKDASLEPIGTGPFKLVEHVSGSHTILERFDNYWGEKSHLDRVVLRTIPDPLSRFIALQVGEVDIATDLLFSQIPSLKKDPNLKFHSVTEARRSSWGTLWFNFRRWPMNQLKFRQAVVMGADWRYIAKVIFPKGIDTTRYTLFEGTWWENKAAKKLLPTYNPSKARELLKEVEAEAGKPIPHIYAVTSRAQQEIPGAALQIGAQKLKEIGLNLDVNIIEHELVRDKLMRSPKSDWDIILGAYQSAAVDPAETVKDFYKDRGHPDGTNMSHYTNAVLDKLIEKGGTTFDRGERRNIYQEAEMILLKDLVVFPMFDIPNITAYNKRVHDFPAHDSAHPLFHTSWNNVWIDK